MQFMFGCELCIYWQLSTFSASQFNSTLTTIVRSWRTTRLRRTWTEDWVEDCQDWEDSLLTPAWPVDTSPVWEVTVDPPVWDLCNLPSRRSCKYCDMRNRDRWLQIIQFYISLDMTWLHIINMLQYHNQSCPN